MSDQATRSELAVGNDGRCGYGQIVQNRRYHSNPQTGPVGHPKLTGFHHERLCDVAMVVTVGRGDIAG